MHANAMPSNPSNKVVPTRQHREAAYQRVCDARKHPIRGLWKRNHRYYAHITVEEPETGLKKVKRVPLEGAATDAQAFKEFEDPSGGPAEGNLPVLKLPPTFCDHADQCIQSHNAATDSSLCPVSTETCVSRGGS